MAEENPPITPDDKGQTVRINIPAASDESLEKTAPMGEKTTPIESKGQTVRINMPPPADTGAKRETVVIATPPPAVPKKETTHLHTPTPAVSKPVMPPPPVPKPMAAGGIPKPAVPAAPAPAAPAPVPAAPVAARPIAPKKETARIQIPPQPKTPLHKATVKLEQPKPASVAPAAAISMASAMPPQVIVKDSSSGFLSVVTFLASLIAAAIAAAAYLA